MLDLNLFDDRKKDDSFIARFIGELKNALDNTMSKRPNKNEESNVLEEYDRYERKKVFLDNESLKGNDFAWVMDENSVCISEHGDGGPFSISDVDLPKSAKVGEVYEMVDGEFVYNAEVTERLNRLG